MRGLRPVTSSPLHRHTPVLARRNLCLPPRWDGGPVERGPVQQRCDVVGAGVCLLGLGDSWGGWSLPCSNVGGRRTSSGRSADPEQENVSCGTSWQPSVVFKVYSIPVYHRFSTEFHRNPNSNERRLLHCTLHKYKERERDRYREIVSRESRAEIYEGLQQHYGTLIGVCRLSIGFYMCL